MKYKLKTRLFAALALSGVSLYWPASRVKAQEDDFGFIRPAEPARQDDQQLGGPPITQASPPIVQREMVSELLQPSNAVRPPAAMPPVVQSQQPHRRPSVSAPVPFASSSVFNGAYVPEGNPGQGHAQHQSPSNDSQQGTVQQVSHQQPVVINEVPPILSGAQTDGDLPPIVRSGNRPTRRNEVPRILLPTPPVNEPGLPPIVSPNNRLARLLSPIQPSDRGGLSTANESSIDEASSVQPASFGASPLLIQGAPPIVGSIAEEGAPGGLPSVSGALVPIDPTVNLLNQGGFPRATPDSGSVAPRSVFEQALSQPPQPPTTPGQTTARPTIPAQTIPAQTFFDPAAQQAPVAAHGSSVCGCTSCGEGGCFDPAQVENMFNTSGANAYARRYAIAEVLYFDRTEGQINNSNFGSLNNFDPGGGARITIGQRTDSTRGREFQYSGIDSAEQTLQIFQPSGLAQSQFVPIGGLAPANLQAFFNATEQSQSAETYFHSLEFNRVKWGWDVIKSYIGLRYIYVDDEYTLFSQSLGLAGGSPTPAESGFFQLAATNHLIGPHIGGELYYDIGYRWSLSGVSRLGAYLNINTFDTNLVNNGVEFINAEDTNTTISFTYEIGVNAKFRLTRQAQFRIGYNILFFDNLATASDNLQNDPAFGGGIPLSPIVGSTTTDEESVLFHGLSLGFEIYR